MTPVTCLVTDRRRLAGGLDGVMGQVAAAARAGVHLVQIRERDLDARTLVRLAEACVAAVRGWPTRILINDRLDVALAANAHGVHLRSDSVPPARVRSLVPAGFLIGRSVHAGDDVTSPAIRGVDYLIFGPVFATSSKPDVTPAGTASLEAAVRATSIPVLAIGGVTVETAAAVGATGAAGVAGIGLFAGRDEEAVQQTLASIRNAFDSARRRS